MSKFRVASVLLVCASVAFFGLTPQASATIITLTEAGQIFGGTANGSGTLCSTLCSASGYTWTGQPFTLTYTFDTSLAAAGSYTNNGSSSRLSGSFNFLSGGTFVGSATGLPGIFGFNPAGCTSPGCSSSENDTASVGSTYSQSVSWIFSGGADGATVSTALFANLAIPGDITAAFALSGPDIGSGSFDSFASPGTLCGLGANWQCLSGDLQIETVTANGALLTTPLPAALPLFAAALGIMGLLGWRRKRKAA
jgi:hypothetical protein